VEGERDVCARPRCGWYRFQHIDRDDGHGPRCPYHYRRQKDGTYPTFQEKDPPA
jgi:hypothetical protein